MIVMCLFSFLFILLVPSIPKVGKFIPTPLIVMILCTIVNHYGDLNTKTVGDMGEVSGSFPTPYFPKIIDFDFHKAVLIFEKAIEFGMIGLIESLMTL